MPFLPHSLPPRWFGLALSLLLLTACSVDPLRLPAPVEQRNSTPASERIDSTTTASTNQHTPTAPTPAPVLTNDSSAAVNDTTTALLKKAHEQAAGGQYQRAAGTLERAIRIAPDDAELWYELARIRLRQGQLDEAEELAIKSRTMATQLPDLQARNWRLVAVVRQQRGDASGAGQALKTARGLEHGGR